MEGIVLPLELLGLGGLTLFLEVFVPSGGVITVMALGCFGAAVALAFVRGGTHTGLAFLAAVILLVPACIVIGFIVFPKTPIGKRLMLRSSQSPETGYVAQDSKEKELVGQTGVALSHLRPSGEAKINDRRYDVITEGEMIEKGTKIVVRSVGGNRIVVRRAQPERETS